MNTFPPPGNQFAPSIRTISTTQRFYKLNLQHVPIIADDGSDDGGEDEKDEGDNDARKPICQGNQIYKDYEGGKLPNVKDNSGPQQPVCMKADGSPGSPARINREKLYKSVSGYFKELVDKKWVIKEGGPTPKAPVLEGQAQNGMSM
ncbi:hypothetical protein QBC37DRAFT_379122 [Rhypophila decipiens]|uniref:Uncharacterized protein n=1 Tax=Rhypophila decipiens TaxID=261697 RepID=A0AAN6XZD9_9PEZI|nr:hypothetical protein QBC37DRAFT_379122 [Rhypophila decipiens]